MAFGIDLSGIGDIFSGAGTLAKDIRSAVTGEISPEKKAELESKALELEAMAMNAQAEINKVEAASPNLFVAGWRPFIGWCSGIGFLYIVIIRPLIIGFFKITVPDVDSGLVVTVLGGMLGIGIPRTVEKLKGAQGNH
jgi:hypothetical protein